MNIEIISASPRTKSVTFRLALFLQKYLSEISQHHVDIIDVRDWSFPLMQQEVFSDISHTPESLAPLAERIFDANAFIIVTPEYNGSYTAALKNLFDHFPRQQHKAFGIVTASSGSMGGMRATQQIQLLIHALFGIGSPFMLVTPHVEKKFDVHGNLTDETFLRNVEIFTREFLWLSEQLTCEKAVLTKV